MLQAAHIRSGVRWAPSTTQTISSTMALEWRPTQRLYQVRSREEMRVNAIGHSHSCILRRLIVFIFVQTGSQISPICCKLLQVFHKVDRFTQVWNTQSGHLSYFMHYFVDRPRAQRFQLPRNRGFLFSIVQYCVRKIFQVTYLIFC